MLFVIIALLVVVMFLSGVLGAGARRERRRQRVIALGQRTVAKVIDAAPTGQKRGGLCEVEVRLELGDGRRAHIAEWLTPREMIRAGEGAEVQVSVRETAESFDVVLDHPTP